MLSYHPCLADILPQGGTRPGNDLPTVTVERNQPLILTPLYPNGGFLGFAYHLPTTGPGHSCLPRVPWASCLDLHRVEDSYFSLLLLRQHKSWIFVGALMFFVMQILA